MATHDESVVEFEFTVTFRDYLRLVYWHSFRRRPVLGPLLAGIPALAILVLAVGSRRGHESLSGWRAWALGLAGIGCWLALLAAAVYVPARRAYASNRAMQGPRRHRFSREGVASESEMGSGRMSWEACWRAFETKTDFYLYFANNLAYLIPKRCFASSQEMETFRSILRSSLSPTICRLRT